ncbi:uncharacterized protein L969DRAFT_85964 [Mixia osmundae IAM 14324]|uniref:Uncharacterized protein n=1 Tax=Mixia osmundae (strain CBS 9802 / IAM 14324 / JCM 22182 / KY 12970) TaxID=764103 RepID=G7E5K1_MIXOS|nr:uncharacterized protein L969DRAFT_85964 [Mixia osmundae IAM 14324]KEI40742.1 hypothetical protein L969DRAFT_85964 [Mixia osmundae IAM 14324]GAA98111.1 hypothetical protein E5Q_04794 [Mixia osmundae IAM 14324]
MSVDLQRLNELLACIDKARSALPAICKAVVSSSQIEAQDSLGASLQAANLVERYRKRVRAAVDSIEELNNSLAPCQEVITLARAAAAREPLSETLPLRRSRTQSTVVSGRKRIRLSSDASNSVPYIARTKPSTAAEDLARQLQDVQALCENLQIDTVRLKGRKRDAFDVTLKNVMHACVAVAWLDAHDTRPPHCVVSNVVCRALDEKSRFEPSTHAIFRQVSSAILNQLQAGHTDVELVLLTLDAYNDLFTGSQLRPQRILTASDDASCTFAAA